MILDHEIRCSTGALRERAHTRGIGSVIRLSR